jgi:hypothetical protein
MDVWNLGLLAKKCTVVTLLLLPVAPQQLAWWERSRLPSSLSWAPGPAITCNRTARHRAVHPGRSIGTRAGG